MKQLFEGEALTDRKHYYCRCRGRHGINSPDFIMQRSGRITVNFVDVEYYDVFECENEEELNRLKLRYLF